MLERFQARFAATVGMGETQRLERTLATARAFLAVTSLVAIWIDPTEPSRYATLSYGLLVIYVAHSLLILVLVQVRAESSRGFRFGIHAVDVLWPTLMSYFSSGPNSPFFVFNIFPLLAAAYRWGFLETMATAGAAIVLFFSQLIFFQAGPASMQALLGGAFEANRFIMRGIYLLIAGYLLGFLSEEEKRLRAETAAIARIISRVQRQVGLRGVLTAIFDEILRLFDSRRALLALEEAATGRIYLWRGAREENSGEVRLTPSEIAAEERSTYLFVRPGQTWHVARRKSSRSDSAWDLYVLSEKGTRLTSVTWRPPAALPAAEPFSSLLATALHYGNEWTGQLLLLDPRNSEPGMAVPLLQAIVRQGGPVIYSVYLTHRLRSHVGAVERARVARELHDGVIQSLIGLEMQVDVLRRQPASTENVPEELARIQRLLRQEVLNLRELMAQMKPVDLGPHRLLDFLAATVDRFGRDTGMTARFISPLEEIRLPARVANEVARIVQEALTNIRRHSHARAVIVRLDARDGSWLLVISDDGRGFDFSGRLNQAQLDAARQGPLVIKERVRSIGGGLWIESPPGKGARLEITFPQRAHG